MSELSHEERFIVEILKKNEGKLNYKELQTLWKNNFEGIKLILKKLKEKGIIEYIGMIPGFSVGIELEK